MGLIGAGAGPMGNREDWCGFRVAAWAEQEPRGAARAGGDAQDARLSRPVRAAALLRRHSRHSCRLAAPGRLAANSSSPTMKRRPLVMLSLWLHCQRVRPEVRACGARLPLAPSLSAGRTVAPRTHAKKRTRLVGREGDTLCKGYLRAAGWLESGPLRVSRSHGRGDPQSTAKAY